LGSQKQGDPQEQVDYVATILQVAFWGMTDALKKRNIFSQVSVTESYDTSDPALGDEDYIVWLHLSDVGGAQWFTKRKGIPENMIIQMDLSEKGTAKVLTWLNSIQDNLTKKDSLEG
jgi:hypothetical protein